jgi:hypothetical protein
MAKSMHSGGVAPKDPAEPNSQNSNAAENSAFQPSSAKSHDQKTSAKHKGTKPGGPKTPAGKKKSAANSLRDGIFSDEVIIEGLGEKFAAYDEMKQYCWNFFQPLDAMEELQFCDFVNNLWRRNRVRRAERRYLQNRVVEVHWEQERQRAAEVDKLKVRFTSLFRDHVIYRHRDLPPELEEVRGQLMNSSLGTTFLLELFGQIDAELEDSGYLAGKFQALFDFCIDSAGRSNVEMLRILHLDAQSGGDDSKYHKIKELTPTGKEAGVKKGGEIRGNMEKVIVASAIHGLTEHQQKLKQIEMSRASSEVCMAVVGQGSSDRFARAETQHERRMYKALSAWMLLRAESAALSLPPAMDDESA